MNRKEMYISFLLLFIFSAFTNNVMANNNEIQNKCFNTLKSNVSEITQFQEPYQGFKDMEYSDLENKFSKYYKNISSFGIDLDEPLFELRLHSFGEQTGYSHPPYSPFADHKKSDKWDEPAKEYILAEEYITKPDGTKQFLSCSFMQISSNDLMNVTAENYFYDGEIISLVKKSNELDYKAWYNENVSYDYNDQPFVSWKRLFIYPEETKNDFFDRYSIVESFPGNISNSFDVFKEKEKTNDEEGEEEIYTYLKDENGNIINYNGPEELAPAKTEGNNQVFPLFSYYQDIENSFPELGENIALRGEVKFDSLKEMIAQKDNTEYAHIWNTVLDSKGITKYAKAKEEGNEKELFKEGDIEFYEKNLELIGNYEEEIKEIKNEGETKKDKEKSEEKIKEKIKEKKDLENKSNENNVIFFVIILVLIALAGGTLFLKRKK